VETRTENDNKDRLRELTSQIAVEQDHDKFTQLVRELIELLDEQNHKAADA
jgi:hypothetical protein